MHSIIEKVSLFFLVSSLLVFLVPSLLALEIITLRQASPQKNIITLGTDDPCFTLLSQIDSSDETQSFPKNYVSKDDVLNKKSFRRDGYYYQCYDVHGVLGNISVTVESLDFIPVIKLFYQGDLMAEAIDAYYISDHWISFLNISMDDTRTYQIMVTTKDEGAKGKFMLGYSPLTTYSNRVLSPWFEKCQKKHWDCDPGYFYSQDVLKEKFFQKYKYYRKVYECTAVAGDVVKINVGSKEFTPSLQIFYGERLVAGDNGEPGSYISETGYMVATVDTIVEQTGTYQIIVTTTEAGDKGEYIIESIYGCINHDSQFESDIGSGNLSKDF